MTEFKLVISDPKARKAYSVELKSPEADKLLGKRIGDVVKGDSINLAGFEFKITGGSDKQGFPIRPEIPGTKRLKILIGTGPGIKNKKGGERERKSVRGNQISDEISQINMKVMKSGSKTLGIVLGKETEETEKKEEPLKEDVKSESKEENKS